MADYTSTSDVLAQLPEGGWTTDYDTQIGALITSASRLIDNYLGVWPNYFYPSSDTQTRYFDGHGFEYVCIDDCISIAQVAVAETGDTDYTNWTVDVDYVPHPYNYSNLGVPIRELHIHHNGDKYNFPAFPRAVSVTGVFGYSLTPPDNIAMACKVQVMKWMMRSKSAWQNQGAGSPMNTDTLTGLDDDVKVLLLPYMVTRFV